MTVTEAVLELVVAHLDEPASGVRLVELVSPTGADLPEWQPGAHIDLCLTDDLVRQYSLCGDPSRRDRWTVAVLREPEGRGGSSYVHDKLALGDRITVRGPRNSFELAPAPRYVFIAGGIGITPLVPMIAAAEAAGADWSLDYGGRSRASMAFAGNLSARHGDRVRLHPQDETGLIDLPAVLARATPGAVVYCCGPEPLLDAVDAVCRQHGHELRVERFSPITVERDQPDASFEVELAESGMTLRVPADQSVLSVLEAAGIGILSSCREGTCGTCETGVLEGEVDHRDSLLTDAERAANDVMFVCVSRASCPKLVLEL
ncbi:PDR/VanB family oxidoreductase [Nocardioides sp. CER19]|uniref:PDR/VanB family oxidoreductase n=1 Tax=Nocardioides sp. CER19 TaxID=3038538 RepID=UPI00244C3924|nr:PDR/VanB family oxidoreductase [Nocardioides sp. CER19]MDH2412565.1 PDR/VanB family oxidoreductase [Nocardioides sp. CER19]